jgi:hypothetical protein
MSNYNSTVQYFRVNANNTAIATSNNGVGTTSPTEEITAPVLGGTYVSGASTAIIVGAASEVKTSLTLLKTNTCITSIAQQERMC